MSITVVQALAGANGAALTMTANPTVGQPIIVLISDAGSATPFGNISDPNNGTYNLIATWIDTTNSSQVGLWYIIASSTTAPVISLSSGPAAYIINGIICSGFTGTPTVDTAFGTTQWQSSGTSTPSFSPITSNFDNEILLMAANPRGGSFITVDPANWTVIGSGDGFYTICNTHGTAKNFSCTLNISAVLDSLLGGIYDAQPDTLTGQAIL